MSTIDFDFTNDKRMVILEGLNNNVKKLVKIKKIIYSSSSSKSLKINKISNVLLMNI
jgi:predicted transcriptional regulator